MSRELFAEIREAQEAGRPPVLATVPAILTRRITNVPE